MSADMFADFINECASDCVNANAVTHEWNRWRRQDGDDVYAHYIDGVYAGKVWRDDGIWWARTTGGGTCDVADLAEGKRFVSTYGLAKFLAPVHLGGPCVVPFTTDDGEVNRLMRAVIESDGGGRVAWFPVKS